MIIFGVAAAFFGPLLAILTLISGFVWFVMVLGFLIFTYQGLKQLSKAQKETTKHADLGYKLAKIILVLFITLILGPFFMRLFGSEVVADFLSALIPVAMRFLGLAVTFIIGLMLLSEDVEEIKPLVKVGQGLILLSAVLYSLSLLEMAGFDMVISGGDSFITMSVAVIHFIALSKFAKVHNI